jgi:t-SNARE complex subunit (syntaxin)
MLLKVHDESEKIKKLEADLQLISEMFQDIKEITQMQGEGIDTIENNIMASNYRIEQGKTDLEIASTYSFNRTRTILCGTVGILMGGPVGFFLGVKVGLASSAILGTCGIIFLS